MTRCSLDLEQIADGWNAMSTDLSAYCWTQLFNEKLGLEYEVTDQVSALDDDSIVTGGAGPLPVGIQDSKTVRALKDLAK